jgi:hypothetical protein
MRVPAVMSDSGAWLGPDVRAVSAGNWITFSFRF